MFERYLETLKRIDCCAEEGATVLVRIDINSPLSPSGDILDDYRIQAHAETIRYLAERNAKVVILAHQGRPGRDDFTSLERHREILEKYVGREVKFVDDVMGPAAREAIKGLKPGEILLLDNVRFVSEEVIERRMELQSRTYLVRRLSPLANYFVFDGFAVAHRAQPSVVGFPQVLPSCMGLVLERELRALATIEGSRSSATLIVGGAKVPETLRAIEEALSKNLFSKVLVGGLVGAVFIAAKYGFVSSALRAMLEGYGLLSLVDYAKKLLDSWGDRIEVPCDVAIEAGGARIDVDVYSISGEIMDVGSTTIRMYSDIVRKSEVVVFSGPLGYIERDVFMKGTSTLLTDALSYGKKVIVGGGHTIAVARRLGVIDKLFHVSTGGRAFLEALVGKELPALRALELSTRRFWGG